jgi:hypothetical protein
MTRTTIDDRLHRVCAIMIGMTTIAAVVGVVTIAIHDRSIDSEKPPGFVFAPACSSSGKGQSARLSPLSHGGIGAERGGASS